MKKKVYLFVCLGFLLLLFTSMMFAPESNSNNINNQTSQFDSSIQGELTIPDGNIDYEVKYDYEGNKLSNLNAAISNQVTDLFERVFDFVKKIIKKLVS